MSVKSDKFESDIVNVVSNYIGSRLPDVLPDWLVNEGVNPGDIIIQVEGIGSKSKDNKTDVIIYLKKSKPIKISVKLSNADFYGNWYGHIRFLDEFGLNAFKKMTTASVAFANKWAKTATAPFVGVSICFGKRPGVTGQNFTDIFSKEDIITIVKGKGDGDSCANCLYISNKVPKDIDDLINNLVSITIDGIEKATQNFMVAHRPVNPITSGSDRGKCVYSKFKPYKKLDTPTTISKAHDLFKLGSFVEIEPNRLNHNKILDELRDEYNIIIPRKEKAVKKK